MSDTEVTKSVEEKAAEAMEGGTLVSDSSMEVAHAPGVREVEQLQRRPTEIVVREGMLVPQTLAEATRIAKGLMESGCLPKSLNTVPKVLMAQQFLRQIGLPDIAALPRICVINGSYSLWGEGPKAICQPFIEDFEEFLFDAAYTPISFQNKNLNAEPYGAYCRIKRMGIVTPVERTFTTDDAKKAKLLGKSGPWQEYPKRMLQMRARSWALKDGFPDRLMGTAIAEYDHNTVVNEHGDPETTDLAPKLVERFK